MQLPSPSSFAFGADSGTGNGNGKGKEKEKEMSALDAFFARAAAALPPPPLGRGAALDPTDVRVYPPELFGKGKGREESGRKEAFGLVTVPRLVCERCPGGCGCPEGRCACGEACTGCANGCAGEQQEEEVGIASGDGEE